MVKKPKVTEINETLFEIKELGHSVKIQIKKGRRILLCDCHNHTMFCNENPFCYHKELVLEYIKNKPIIERLDKLLESYGKFSNIKMKVDTNMILLDLKDLKELITKK